tara:strand:- start:993 stop:1838 length:846 start_codon:yes stop_codon:yes gene_type:complete
MILIADSGSTKCSWVLTDENNHKILQCNTIGFNPYFIDENSILNHLKNSELDDFKKNIKKIYFYGAGCSCEEMNLIIKKPLSNFFSNASVNVMHDLEAACYAMYNNKTNVTCILGTGSNSCFFDGKNIKENAPSLGFILGDEASGNFFGKKIINYYFNGLFDNELKAKFKANFEYDLMSIKKNIYDSRANVYLSKFFPFVSNNKHHTIIKKLISETLDNFFDVHVNCFKKFEPQEINFIGSVSYFLKDEIKIVTEKNNLVLGEIVKNPIKRLRSYHHSKQF